MSQAEQIEKLYEKIYNYFMQVIEYPPGKHPQILGMNPFHINEILKSCIRLYNYLDSAIVVIETTIPDIFSELKEIIDDEIIGIKSNNYEIATFEKPMYSNQKGKVMIPDLPFLPKGIMNIVSLLKISLYYSETNFTVDRDQYYYTAKSVFLNLKGHLMHFLTRFDYVMLYPHRILLDRTILETGLKKHGYDRVLKYLQSAEEHFNKQKSEEFCAIARNALEEAINNTSLVLEAFDKGFSENLKKLKEIGFFKGTISKQIKEFRGSLSAGGSHPPEEEMSLDEMKLLLDNLYGFLGFIVIRLSKFKK